MKRSFLIYLIISLFLLLNTGFAEAGGHHSRGYSHYSYKSSSHSSSYHVSSGSSHTHSYHISSGLTHSTYHNRNSGSTYKVGTTTYESGKYYSTTGQPKVERSSIEKKKFLKSLGYKRVPAGYEVDHIVPLSEGGIDNPSNMQLLTKSEHKQKTAHERAEHKKRH
jgi:hypothetical protein